MEDVETESDGELRYARGRHGPLYAATYNKGSMGPVHCYDCRQHLSHVKGHERHRGETPYQVRAFFRHPPGGACSGGPESAEHKAAKHRLETTRFQYRVYVDGAPHIQPMPDGDWSQEHKWQKQREQTTSFSCQPPSVYSGVC